MTEVFEDSEIMIKAVKLRDTKTAFMFRISEFIQRDPYLLCFHSSSIALGYL